MVLTSTQKNILTVLLIILGGIVVGLAAFFIIRQLRGISNNNPKCKKDCQGKVCGDSNCPGESCGTCKSGYSCNQSGQCVQDHTSCEGNPCGDNDHCEKGCYCDNGECKKGEQPHPPQTDCYSEGTNPFDGKNNCAKKCCDGLHLCHDGKNLICGNCPTPIQPDCHTGDTSKECCNSSYCPSGCSEQPQTDCYSEGTNPFDGKNNCAKKCCDGLHLCHDGKNLICGNCSTPVQPDCHTGDTSKECCNSTYCPSGCS